MRHCQKHFHDSAPDLVDAIAFKYFLRIDSRLAKCASMVLTAGVFSRVYVATFVALDWVMVWIVRAMRSSGHSLKSLIAQVQHLADAPWAQLLANRKTSCCAIDV